MALPLFKNNDSAFQLMQTQWKAQLDPLLAQPIGSPGFLQNIQLIPGPNVINHRLGRVQQGWFIVDINAVATIYRSQPFNKLTLTLWADAECIVSLMVF